MKRTVLGVGDCLAATRGGSRAQWIMVTLTLRPGVAWHSRMINDYLQGVRRWARGLGIEMPYVWVAELQADRLRRYGERIECVVHYHVVFRLPAGVHMPKADNRGWWPHGMSRTESARRPVGYLAKYVSKGDEQDFPKGLRLYGVGGLDQVERTFRRWWSMPNYLRGTIGPNDAPRRCRGGYVSRVTGEVALSPFRVHVSRCPLTGRRSVHVEDKAGRPPAEVIAANKLFIEQSRRFAQEAGYTWLSAPPLP